MTGLKLKGVKPATNQEKTRLSRRQKTVFRAYGGVLVRGGFHSLQLQASHGTLGNRRPLLQVLEDQLASRSPHLLHSIGLGVVRQPPPVGDSLHHLAALFFFSCRSESSNISL